MTGRINQIKLIALILHAHRRQFDGNALFTLQIHLVQQLGFHVALFDRSGQFQQTVSQRRLTVVNVRNNAKVSDMVLLHETKCNISVGIDN